jgi:hypothetical protein
METATPDAPVANASSVLRAAPSGVPPTPLTQNDSPSAAGAPPASAWQLSVDEDKLTDKKVVTASVRGSSSSTRIYELTLRCDGSGPWPDATIATFNLSNDTEQHGRVISWNTRTPVSDFLQRQGVTITVKDVRVRIDGGDVYGATLTRTYDNAGSSSSLFASHLKVENVASPASDSASTGTSPAPQLQTSVAHPTLPVSRLVVADIFPDETVEFPFNSLTADQRSTLQTMCFSQSK